MASDTPGLFWLMLINTKCSYICTVVALLFQIKALPLQNEKREQNAKN